MIVDHSNKQMNSYFVAYLNAHDVKDGEEVQFHEYSAWITGMHNAFRKLKGREYYLGYPPDVQHEFQQFIRSVEVEK